MLLPIDFVNDRGASANIQAFGEIRARMMKSTCAVERNLVRQQQPIDRLMPNLGLHCSNRMHSYGSVRWDLIAADWRNKQLRPLKRIHRKLLHGRGIDACMEWVAQFLFVLKRLALSETTGMSVGSAGRQMGNLPGSWCPDFPRWLSMSPYHPAETQIPPREHHPVTTKLFK